MSVQILSVIHLIQHKSIDICMKISKYKNFYFNENFSM